MSFILTDSYSEERELQINGWNWRPTLEIIDAFGIIDEERLELMGISTVGACISEDEAHRIGEKIRDEILPKLTPQSRVLYDLTFTEEPDDFELYREESEAWKNYGATYSWLKEFSEFCLSSKGFEVR